MLNETTAALRHGEKIDKKSQCLGMLLYLKLQIGKCKLKISFFQFSFFNYFTRSLKNRLETRKKR